MYMFPRGMAGLFFSVEICSRVFYHFYNFFKTQKYSPFEAKLLKDIII
jgi:hypothetical protein